MQNINSNIIFKKNLRCKVFKLLIIFIFYFHSLFYKYYINVKYINCFHCLEKLEQFNSKCFECPNEILFKDFTVISKENTLDEIIKNNKSISRFGDGEFSLIFGHGINFQNYNNNLSKRLLKVLNSEEKNLLVGIFFPYKKKELLLYRDSVAKFWINWLSGNKFKLLKILNKKKKYYSADITRFYSNFKDKSGVPKFIRKLKKIWEGRDILIIEGEKSRIGIGNNLLNNSKSIKRIICPAKNAFNAYNKILNAALQVSKDILILISLGPTASILAYDLSKLGYQAIDIGHSDIQYELYLRKANKTIQIPFKFVNEFNGGKNEDVGNITDVKYYNQIINKIIY